jgi:hypothetical protein
MVELALREAPTLNAISRLRRKYPYAAALLTYVLVERLLKGYVLEHRKHWKYARVCTPTKKSLGRHKGKCLAALVSLPDDKFLNEVLCRMTLGDVEGMLKLPPNERSAADRNEAMHSNLKQEAALSHRDRHARNIDRLERALKHLRRVFRRCTGRRLLEQGSGRLVAQPNPPMQPSGSAGG